VVRGIAFPVAIPVDHVETIAVDEDIARPEVPVQRERRHRPPAKGLEVRAQLGDQGRLGAAELVVASEAGQRLGDRVRIDVAVELDRSMSGAPKRMSQSTTGRK